LVLLPASATWKGCEERNNESHDHQDDDDQIRDANQEDVPVQIVPQRIERKYSGEPAKYHHRPAPFLYVEVSPKEFLPIEGLKTQRKIQSSEI
jgi:hypothetical protein